MPCPSQSACPTPSRSFSQFHTDRQTDSIWASATQPTVAASAEMFEHCGDAMLIFHSEYRTVPLPQQTDSVSGLKLVLFSSIQPVRALSSVPWAKTYSWPPVLISHIQFPICNIWFSKIDAKDYWMVSTVTWLLEAQGNIQVFNFRLTVVGVRLYCQNFSVAKSVPITCFYKMSKLSRICLHLYMSCW